MKRFSVVPNGYNIEEVNNFIDIVIRKLEQLSADNNNYLMQLDSLKKQMVDNNQNIVNEKVSKALVAAQETTDKMKELAKEEANLIIEEARNNANAIIHEALIDAEKKQKDIELLKTNYNVYRVKLKSLVEGQLELIKNTEEID